MKNLLLTLIKIGISGAILFFLFRNIEIDKFWNIVVSVNMLTVISVALLFFVTQSISTLRWSIILKKDMNISYLRLLSIYFIGMFFNNFLPTMVGGDLVKGYYLYRRSNRGDVSLASIFMDRYAGFTALMVITSIALVAGHQLIKGTGLSAFFALLLGGFAGISLVIWVGPLHAWVMRLLAKVHFMGLNKKIDTFYMVLMSYKDHHGILLKIFICSVVVQSGVIIGYYFLGKGIGMDIGIGYFFLFIPLTTAISMLPISLSGLGIREGAFVYLFTLAGATREQAFALSLMWFGIAAIVSIVGGIEYVRTGGKKAVEAV